MFESLVDQLVRWITLFGGRASSKSRTATLITVVLCILQKRFIVVARDYKDDVEHSIWRNIIERIYELDLNPFFKITKEKITCLITGTEIIPFGLIDNPDKIKSLEGCDLLIMEESAKTPKYVWSKVVPTIRESGSSILSIFNPDWEDDETYKRLVTEQELLKNGYFIRHINYLDNPFLSQEIITEAEADKDKDLEEYEHIWLGKPKSISKIQVFSGVWSVFDFDSDAFEKDKYSESYKGIPKFYNGVAWGISQKPTAAIRCCEYDGSLYIEHSASSVCELDGMVELINSIPTNRKFYCSPEQPATLININKRLSGSKLTSAEKGKDDVLDAIQFLRGNYKHIYIHPRCQDVISDFSRYWWETDLNTGEILDKPVDKHNQHFHALRHALHNQIGIGI